MVFISVFVTALAALVTVTKATLPHLDGRIIGGKPVDIQEFPYQLSLQYFGSHTCGASVLSETLALTAAHCVIGRSPEVFSIRAGSTLHYSGGKLVKISEIIVHPLYSTATLSNDVALLKLAEKLPLGLNIATILPQRSGDEPRSGDAAIVTGWGRVKEGGPLSDKLQAVKLQVKNRKLCNLLNNGRITEEMICASSSGKDSCQGDSGGPLVSKGKQIGIVSWGYGCAQPLRPGVYTNVQKVAKFIDSSGQKY